MEGLLSHPLLSLIADRKLADPQDIEAIQGEHNLSGESVNKLLHNQGILDAASQLELMAEYLGTDVIDVSAIEFTGDLLGLIPPEVAKQYKCLPIGLDGETLHLCLEDPLNPTILDDLAYRLNKPLQLRIADPGVLTKMVDEKYAEVESYEDLTETMMGAYEAEEAVKDDGEQEPQALEILEEVGDVGIRQNGKTVGFDVESEKAFRHVALLKRGSHGEGMIKGGRPGSRDSLIEQRVTSN